MASNRETGKKGEELAERWLLKHGFAIQHCNWRTGRFEIDIIASLADTLHFIEVKTSRQQRYGFPEQRIGIKKMKHFMYSGDRYLLQYPEWRKVQYDIIAIQWLRGHSPSLLFIEDVYLMD